MPEHVLGSVIGILRTYRACVDVMHAGGYYQACNFDDLCGKVLMVSLDLRADMLRMTADFFALESEAVASQELGT